MDLRYFLACLSRYDPGHPLPDTLVEFVHCPPSSPYYDLVESLKGGTSLMITLMMQPGTINNDL